MKKIINIAILIISLSSQIWSQIDLNTNFAPSLSNSLDRRHYMETLADTLLIGSGEKYEFKHNGLRAYVNNIKEVWVWDGYWSKVQAGFSGNWNDLTNVPAGFADGIDNVDDADADPTNEIQDTSNINGLLQYVQNHAPLGSDNQTLTYNPATDEITISNGNTIDITEVDTKLTESEVDAFVSNNGYLTAEVDGSVTNELQNVTGSYNPTTNILTVNISNGTGFSQDLSDLQDAALTQEQVQDYVGSMVSGNTETRITVTYNDAANVFDFVVTPPAWSDITGVPVGFSDGIDNVDDSDNDPTNEIQDTSNINGLLEFVQNHGGDGIGTDTSGTYHISIDQDLSTTNELISNANLNGTHLTITEAGIDHDIHFSGWDTNVSNDINNINEGFGIDVTGSGNSRTVAFDTTVLLDNDPTNELDSIKINGQWLSNGDSISITDNVNDADADPTNEIRNIRIDRVNVDELHLVELSYDNVAYHTDTIVTTDLKFEDLGNDKVSIDLSDNVDALLSILIDHITTEDADIDATNEIQDTSNINGLLQFVEEHGADGVGITSEIDPIYSSDSASIVWFSDLLDNDPTNERDTITINGQALTNGGSITVASAEVDSLYWSPLGSDKLKAKREKIGINITPVYELDVAPKSSAVAGDYYTRIGDGVNGVLIRKPTASNKQSTEVFGVTKWWNGDYSSNFIDESGSSGTVGQVWGRKSGDKMGWINDATGTTYTAGTGINIAGSVISNTGDTNSADDVTGTGTTNIIPVWTGSKIIGNGSLTQTGEDVYQNNNRASGLYATTLGRFILGTDVVPSASMRSPLYVQSDRLNWVSSDAAAVTIKGNHNTSYSGILLDLDGLTANTQVTGLTLKGNASGTNSFHTFAKCDITSKMNYLSKFFDITATSTLPVNTSSSAWNFYQKHIYPSSSSSPFNSNYYGMYQEIEHLGISTTSSADSYPNKYYGGYFKLNTGSSIRARQYGVYLDQTGAGYDDFGIYAPDLVSNYFGGRVGIGTTAPAHALHVVGTTRISTLSGAGTRMVVANANGDLSTQGITNGITSLSVGSVAANVAPIVDNNNVTQFSIAGNQGDFNITEPITNILNFSLKRSFGEMTAPVQTITSPGGTINMTSVTEAGDIDGDITNDDFSALGGNGLAVKIELVGSLTMTGTCNTQPAYFDVQIRNNGSVVKAQKISAGNTSGYYYSFALSHTDNNFISSESYTAYVVTPYSGCNVSLDGVTFSVTHL